MKVDVLKEIPLEELIGLVRTVPLMNKDKEAPKVYPYQNADIQLRKFKPQEVNQATFYLVNKNMQLQSDLREALLRDYNIDSLALNGALELSIEGSGEIWTLTPPIVEVTPRTVLYHPKEGELKHDAPIGIQIPVVMDGAHRTALAKELGLPFNGLYVFGAPEEFPFYAHPNGWDMMKRVDEVPKTKAEKKMYSREDSYGLYRDFGVLGCGTPRKLGQ